tara:strand:- start:20574 stop:22214 length:1641 start_codon:yes stop_codon:yes gene_type:complete
MRSLLINFRTTIPYISNNDGLNDYYQIGFLKEENRNFICRNNEKRLNQIALEQRQIYTDWVADLNSLFLKEELILNNDLSLFYFTDLSNKRNEIFNTFNNICNIKLIEELVLIHNYEHILINGGDDYFYESISSVLKIKVQTFLNSKKENKFIRLGLKNSFFSSYFNYLRLLLKYFLYHLFLYPLLLFSKKIDHKAKNIYFTRYPLHFKENLFLEEKYNFLVKKNDKFFTSIICDGLHQNIDIIKAIKSRISLSSSKKRHIIIDDYINLKIILKSFFNSIIYLFKFNRLLKKNYYYGVINVTKSIKSELVLSFQRVLALILNYECLNLAIKKVNADKYIYYLHEYAFGRMISYSLHKNSRLETVGFQHGPSSMLKLVYSISEKEIPFDNLNYIKSVPIPKSVLAEDKSSKIVYENSGFSNITVLQKIPRLSYLYNIKLNQFKDFILIAAGLHDFEIVYKFALKLIKENSQYKFIFKAHPRSKISFDKYKLPFNAEFSNLDISELFIRAECVYATYSSVALEANFLNIPVKLIPCPGIINQSPLTLS